jgi:hypothetical protein
MLPGRLGSGAIVSVANIHRHSLCRLRLLAERAIVSSLHRWLFIAREASMNDKLEAHGPEKEKRNWSSWAGSPIAWLGLIISLTTAFFSLVYHSDQLSVLIEGGSGKFSEEDGVSISHLQPVTFINSGTRPIAILDVAMTVGQPSSDGCKNFAAYTRLEFESIVLKPSDTVIKRARLPDSLNWDAINLRLGRIIPDQGVPALVCMRFAFVAVDSPVLSSSAEVPLVWTNIKTGDHHQRMPSQTPLLPTLPTYLLKRNRFWAEVPANTTRWW